MANLGYHLEIYGQKGTGLILSRCRLFVDDPWQTVAQRSMSSHFSLAPAAQRTPLAESSEWLWDLEASLITQGKKGCFFLFVSPLLYH